MRESIQNFKTLVAPSGRKYLDTNLGSDSVTPYGKYFTFDEAKKACPVGTRLPTWDEVDQDRQWLIANLPLGASGDGGMIGYVGYYWTGEDENIEPGYAVYLCVSDERVLIINLMEKSARNLARCVVV